MEEFTSKPSESSEENKEDDIILTNGSGDSGLFLPKSTQETGLISPDSISTPVALALSSALKKIEDYVPTEYVDFEEPDIDAINLNHAEQAIMKVTNLMNGAVDVINGLSSQVAQLYSNKPTYNMKRISGAHRCTAPNTYEYTGTAIEVPACKFYIAIGTLGWSHGKPTGIILSDDADSVSSGGLVSIAESDSNASVRFVYHIDVDGTNTLYLWERRANIPSEGILNSNSIKVLYIT